jgi:CTP synthase (UTP-ammonia lyase)
MTLAIIGDYDDNYGPHQATNKNLIHSVGKVRIPFSWIPTNKTGKDFESIITKYQGFWIAPGSPYKNLNGILRIIKYARENNIPVLGTCSGFQHMALEFGRNVLGMEDGEHAEYKPVSETLIITPLSCSLNGETVGIKITDKGSKLYKIYGEEKIYEKFHCKYGLNRKFVNQFNNKGFKVVGIDESNEPRILELENHPFFIATLFVPKDNLAGAVPHKLVTKFMLEVRKGNQLYRQSILRKYF